MCPMPRSFFEWRVPPTALPWYSVCRLHSWFGGVFLVKSHVVVTHSLTEQFIFAAALSIVIFRTSNTLAFSIAYPIWAAIVIPATWPALTGHISTLRSWMKGYFLHLKRISILDCPGLLLALMSWCGFVDLLSLKQASKLCWMLGREFSWVSV